MKLKQMLSLKVDTRLKDSKKSIFRATNIEEKKYSYLDLCILRSLIPLV